MPGFLGVQAVINMILSIVFITVSWWALQVFKFDLFIHHIQSTQAKILHLLFAVALGSLVARFFIEYIEWANWLKFLF